MSDSNMYIVMIYGHKNSAARITDRPDMVFAMEFKGIFKSLTQSTNQPNVLKQNRNKKTYMAP